MITVPVVIISTLWLVAASNGYPIRRYDVTNGVLVAEVSSK